MAFGRAQMATPQIEDKPLPSLPSPSSPTLTNPEMLLPDEGALPQYSSPRWTRPPSLGYLKETNALTDRTPKKEKRGLMSRKMMLLRSRTGSGLVPAEGRSGQRSASSGAEDPSAIASSPTVTDGGSLTPEPRDYKRSSVSGSSFNSDDMAIVPAFLSRHRGGDWTEDESTDNESPGPQRYGYSVKIEGGVDAQRRAQEQDEQTSAMLSRRAEQILANAKRRLNLMEGNLRGARDLVAPLTAANLKRATSLGSSNSPASVYASRERVEPNRYYADSPTRLAETLHNQDSSMTLNRDYHQGHSRGFSETGISERPQTAVVRNTNLAKSGRIPVKPTETSWITGLRASKSFDSVGANGHARGSPESNLGPLQEDDTSQIAESVSSSILSVKTLGLGLTRPESRADDLQEQISSLKGKISSLRERAKEDNMRRQSMLNLRTPSPLTPLNNAAHNAPEMWYTESANYGSPPVDTKAGVGFDHEGSPVTPQASNGTWAHAHTRTGSRNAFAEQAAMRNTEPTKLPDDEPAPLETAVTTSHKRTPSGSAVIGSAKQRYSHHQRSRSGDTAKARTARSVSPEKIPAPELDNEPVYRDVSPLPSFESPTPDYLHEVSDEEYLSESVYEDAQPEQTGFVAHEDREDAFDYQHFFLHSAMATYARSRSPSNDSVSSGRTARAPVPIEGEEFMGPDGKPPPTPETPEVLREIERRLNHSRSQSTDSASTLASFATADEGHGSPTPGSNVRPDNLDWPIPPSMGSPDHTTRPNTAPPRHIPPPLFKDPDAISDRADSGVGLGSTIPRRAASSNSHGRYRRPGALSPKSVGSVVQSPPMSPATVILDDPATVAVNALLNPKAAPLGLKDKAMVFSVVESLRNAVARLQEVEEGGYEGKIWRRRLHECKTVLDGVAEAQ